MAGLIPREFIDEVLSRIDIVELIEQHVPLKKRGVNFQACCPFHQEKSPSFNVNPKKQFYHCFGCGANGNAVSFLMDYLHLGFVDAIEQLAERVGMPLPKRTDSDREQQGQLARLHEFMQLITQFYQRQWREHPQANLAIDYIKKRGINREIAKLYEIGFAPPGWDNCLKEFSREADLIACGMLVQNDQGKTYDRYRNRIMFPIHDRRGRVIGFGGRSIDPNDQPKYLNSPETKLFHKSHELYGLYQVMQAGQPESIIIVEGYMDVIALAQFGFQNVVATLGTATGKEHLRTLTRITPNLIFCFDGDKAGRAAAWRALEIALPEIHDGINIRFLFLPEKDDPDSFVRQHGHDAFLQRIGQALPLSQYFLRELESKVDLSDMNGRSRLADLAKPYLQNMNALALKRLIIEELSHKVRIDPDRLAGIISGEQELLTANKPRRQRQLTTGQFALSLLLQNPALGIELASELAKKPKPSTLNNDLHAVLYEVTDLLSKKPDLTTAAIVEYWRETNHFNSLLELAAWPHHVPDDGIVPEFSGAISKLNQQTLEREIAQLLKKASSSGLTNEERQQLQTMIARSKTQE